MYARLSRYRGDMDRFVESYRGVALLIEQWEGLEHAYLLVDRENGDAISASFWVDRASIERNMLVSDTMRHRVMSEAGVSTESIVVYEVVRTLEGPHTRRGTSPA